jgi:predicted metalloprotease
MQWAGQRQSGNVEDRRGMGMPMMAGGGLGTLVLALVIYMLGGNPGVVLQQPGAGGSTRQAPAKPGAQDDQMKQFVSVVLADTEDAWHDIFPKQFHTQYEDPALVLFTERVQSGCGVAGAEVGPFYCPADHKVYIDLSFYQEMKERFGAPGDFAQAYVIAHEVGHHVQNLLGISDKVTAASQRNPSQANALSVRTELQADCFAGIWGHYAQRTKNILEQGDLEEAMNAAAAIGDDRLQRQAGRRVSPESFTHGTSEQRQRWFRAGFDSGDPQRCDTFNSPGL